MRHASLPFALFFLSAALPVFALEITHTEPRRFDKVPFTRLCDLFGHPKENPTRLALFSNPNEHAGLYFNTTLDTRVSKIPAGTLAQVELLMEGDGQAQTFRFEIPPTQNRSKHLYLGITDEPFATLGREGASGPRSRLQILAWKVSLLDKDGKVLASSASPLWEY